MTRPLRQRDEILRLMRDGWELRHHVGGAIGWYSLHSEHDSTAVHASTVHAMLRAGVIAYAEKRKSDPFWLRRFVTVPQ